MKQSKIKALFFNQDAEGIYIELDNTLEAKQELVKGYIEFVELRHFGGPNAEAIVNEEGLYQFHPNRYLGESYQTLSGPIIVTGPADEDGNSTSLDEATLEQTLEFFKNRYDKTPCTVE
jgi:hypothetical protein